MRVSRESGAGGAGMKIFHEIVQVANILLTRQGGWIRKTERWIA
jgi:hypothetical protein